MTDSSYRPRYGVKEIICRAVGCSSPFASRWRWPLTQVCERMVLTREERSANRLIRKERLARIEDQPVPLLGRCWYCGHQAHRQTCVINGCACTVDSEHENAESAPPA